MVDGLRDLRMKAAGVVLVLAAIGALFATLATYFADQVKAFLFRLFH